MSPAAKDLAIAACSVGLRLNGRCWGRIGGCGCGLRDGEVCGMGEGVGGGMDRASCRRSWVMCIIVCPSPHACSQFTLTPPAWFTARLIHVSKHLRKPRQSNADESKT